MKNKRQHIIPKCYQKSWCDPGINANEEPYVWHISRDGSNVRRKSPKKSFVESDIYTIRLPNGERDLLVEETLSKIESKFVKLIRNKVEKGYTLDTQDKGDLCIFAAAMFSRVNCTAKNYEQLLTKVFGTIKLMEEYHGSNPDTSIEVKEILNNMRPEAVRVILPRVSLMYFQMSMCIFVAQDADFFITSDSPTVWYNPDSYRLPSFFRSPGLAHENIEVTLPLTPRHLLYLSHNKSLSGYRKIDGSVVQEVNRRSRFHCDEWFISCSKETQQEWFNPRVTPEDSWENAACEE